LAEDAVPALSKGKGKLVPEEEPSKTPAILSPSSPAKTVLVGPEVATSSRPVDIEMIPSLDPASPAAAITSPTSVLYASELLSSPVAPPGDDNGMEHEAFYLELVDLDEPVACSDSSKKRKHEDGEEFSSPFFH